MKHKPDAIKYVNNIIDELKIMGLDDISAQRACVVVLRHKQDRWASLPRRALNYANSIVYGEEKAIQMDVLYNKIDKFWDGANPTMHFFE